MDWKKALGFGVLFWAIMFAIASVFVAYETLYEAWAQGLLLVLSFVVPFVLAGWLGPLSGKAALQYGAAWAVVGVALDALITYRFDDTIFTQGMYWLSYVLVLMAPVLRNMFRTGVGR